MPLDGTKHGCYVVQAVTRSWCVIRPETKSTLAPSRGLAASHCVLISHRHGDHKMPSTKLVDFDTAPGALGGQADSCVASRRAHRRRAIDSGGPCGSRYWATTRTHPDSGPSSGWTRWLTADTLGPRKLPSSHRDGTPGRLFGVAAPAAPARPANGAYPAGPESPIWKRGVGLPAHRAAGWSRAFGIAHFRRTRQPRARCVEHVYVGVPRSCGGRGRVGARLSWTICVAERPRSGLIAQLSSRRYAGAQSSSGYSLGGQTCGGRDQHAFCLQAISRGGRSRQGLLPSRVRRQPAERLLLCQVVGHPHRAPPWYRNAGELQ